MRFGRSAVPAAVQFASAPSSAAGASSGVIARLEVIYEARDILRSMWCVDSTHHRGVSSRTSALAFANALSLDGCGESRRDRGVLTRRNRFGQRAVTGESSTLDRDGNATRSRVGSLAHADQRRSLVSVTVQRSSGLVAWPSTLTRVAALCVDSTHNQIRRTQQARDGGDSIDPGRAARLLDVARGRTERVLPAVCRLDTQRDPESRRT